MKAYRSVEKTLFSNEQMAELVKKDIEQVQPICKNLLKNSELSSADKKILKGLELKDIASYVLQKETDLRSQAARSRSMQCWRECSKVNWSFGAAIESSGCVVTEVAARFFIHHCNKVIDTTTNIISYSQSSIIATS